MQLDKTGDLFWNGKEFRAREVANDQGESKEECAPLRDKDDIVASSKKSTSTTVPGANCPKSSSKKRDRGDSSEELLISSSSDSEERELKRSKSNKERENKLRDRLFCALKRGESGSTDAAGQD